MNNMELHRAAWERVLVNAKERTFQKYGIYGSRILSVRYPEIFLQADDLFWQIVSTVEGFQHVFEIKQVEDRYIADFPDLILAGTNTGLPFSMTRVNSNEYKVCDYEDLQPEGYPVFSWLDQRMAPLAVTLKDKYLRLTPLERAEHEYFREKERGAAPDKLFLIVCDDGSAFLSNDGSLWSARENGPVTEIQGNPVLIFNHATAWYPLMDRFETDGSDQLRQLVDSLVTDVVTPAIDPWEYAQVERLKKVTQLETDPQFDLATVIAGRAHGIGRYGITRVWDRVFPHQDFSPLTLSLKLGVLKECNRYANWLSPATAYLAGLILGGKDQESGIRAFGQEYLKHNGVIRPDAREWKKAGRLEAWGHLWGCCLFEYTIDDMYRTQGGGHCISQAMASSPALDLAGVDHYVTHFSKGGIGSRDHHFIYSCDGEFVIDDGIVNYFAKDHPTTINWGSLLSFTRDGRWAGTLAGQFYGNVSPVETIDVIKEIAKMAANKFDLSFQSRLEAGDRILSMEEFFGYLQSIEPEWQPVILP